MSADNQPPAATGRFERKVGFDLLPEGLSNDIPTAIREGIEAGACFAGGADPLSIFRSVIGSSIRDITQHEKGRLLQDFLSKGPYEREGPVPHELVGERLSDDEVASAVSFIHGHVLNSFQGAIAELLAVPACLRIVEALQSESRLPATARLHIGDVVMVGQRGRSAKAKGADIHILAEEGRGSRGGTVTVLGVGEVKSYPKSKKGLRAQLDKHIARVRLGLTVRDEDYSPDEVRTGARGDSSPIKILVVPDTWKLPRGFRFERTGEREVLQVARAVPSASKDRIERVLEDEWHVTLRWSKEALAEAAYSIAFWYMEQLGEVLYQKGVPEEWSEMTAAEAGANAAKVMLYYAILRAQTRWHASRAIALYNTYAFGYALGANFKDARGKREMLWFEDLREILESNKTRHGFRIV